jgi:hypothetical protein
MGPGFSCRSCWCSICETPLIRQGIGSHSLTIVAVGLSTVETPFDKNSGAIVTFGRCLTVNVLITDWEGVQELVAVKQCYSSGSVVNDALALVWNWCNSCSTTGWKSCTPHICWGTAELVSTVVVGSSDCLRWTTWTFYQCEARYKWRLNTDSFVTRLKAGTTYYF